jgi:hypothetical protein
MTVADMTARTALPLHSVRELVPRAADEYNARLKVSGSGEILYSFPGNFKSRYRGFGASFGSFSEKALSALGSFFSSAFKVWIMIMLAGYFVLFILLTLAAVFLTVAASGSSGRRGGRRSSGGQGSAFFISRMTSMIFRFWFYSSLGGGGERGYSRNYPLRGSAGGRGGDERPFYKKVFSFVFGDGDPNKAWEKTEAIQVIGYLRKNNGVISLPEFAILTGMNIQKAEREILSYCVNYGGMPEATEDGTVIYRFDSLLLAAEKETAVKQDAVKSRWKFSANTDKTNTALTFVNLANLGFGCYFLYFVLNLDAMRAGRIIAGSFLFRFVNNFLALHGIPPAPSITIVLGIVPIAFSLLFWGIPALRKGRIKKKNAAITLENRRKKGFARIWDKPLAVTEEDLRNAVRTAGEGEGAEPEGNENTNRIIKEMGVYSIPEAAYDERGRLVYSFTGLDEEKKALETYRAGVDKSKHDLGKIVFDSGA